MWRLVSGELPRVNIPKLVLIEIGANDLGALANETLMLAEVDPFLKR